MNFADIKIGMVVRAFRDLAGSSYLGEVIELDPDAELVRVAWDDENLEDADWHPAHALSPEVEP